RRPSSKIPPIRSGRTRPNTKNLIGLREGRGDKADKMIVATQSYETTEATVDSPIVALPGSSANGMLTSAIPQSDTLAIRNTYVAGAVPTQRLTRSSKPGGAVMRPAAPEKPPDCASLLAERRTLGKVLNKGERGGGFNYGCSSRCINSPPSPGTAPGD